MYTLPLPSLPPLHPSTASALHHILALDPRYGIGRGLEARGKEESLCRNLTVQVQVQFKHDNTCEIKSSIPYGT